MGRSCNHCRCANATVHWLSRTKGKISWQYLLKINSGFWILLYLNKIFLILRRNQRYFITSAHVGRSGGQVLSVVNETWIFSRDLKKIIRYQNFMKIHPLRSETVSWLWDKGRRVSSAFGLQTVSCCEIREDVYPVPLDYQHIFEGKMLDEETAKKVW